VIFVVLTCDTTEEALCAACKSACFAEWPERNPQANVETNESPAPAVPATVVGITA